MPNPWIAAIRSAALTPLVVMTAYYSSLVTNPPPIPGNPAARIAANLRALRARRKLSIVALAERSGVARATLTKLEAGRGNPTIDTLYALADALGVALGDVIGEPTSTPVQILRADEGIHVRGIVSARLLDRVHGHGLAEFYEVDFAGPDSPEASPARHADPHPRGVMESLIVTSGRLRTGPTDAPAELGPGDFIRFPGDVPHVYQAIGGPARAILMMSHP
jgi:transcriptional regulator with XRE-family HTH domain